MSRIAMHELNMNVNEASDTSQEFIGKYLETMVPFLAPALRVRGGYHRGFVVAYSLFFIGSHLAEVKEELLSAIEEYRHMVYASRDYRTTNMHLDSAMLVYTKTIWSFLKTEKIDTTGLGRDNRGFVRAISWIAMSATAKLIASGRIAKLSK